MIAHGLVSHRARRSLSYEPGFFFEQLAELPPLTVSHGKESLNRARDVQCRRWRLCRFLPCYGFVDGRGRQGKAVQPGARGGGL